MTIIQQAMEIITKSYGENLEKTLRGESDFGAMVLSFEEELRKAGTILVQGIMETLDEEIRESRSRKRSWYVERRDEPKTLSTVLGPVTYRRTYYRHKQTGRYGHLADNQVGIEPHQRTDEGLSARVLEHAATMSYQETVNRLSHSGITSKMSVLNVIRRTEHIPNEAVPTKKKETPEVLYVEADEDHVAMQKGPSAIAKIVYVHEGRKHLHGSRHELINKRYFADTGDTTTLWIDVADYLEATYDMEKVKVVYLSGDGAHWIREGLQWMEKSVFVLDKFHLTKYVRQATAHLPHTMDPLWNHIRRGMREDARKLLNAIARETSSSTKKAAVQEAGRYILNHWSAIQRQKSEHYVGCSAEGHVSHVLSARMSSRPMGWSRDGMRQMSSMRVYKNNGGAFYDLVVRQVKEKRDETRIIRLDKRIAQRAKKAISGMIPNVSFLYQGRRSGTAVLLKSARGL